MSATRLETIELGRAAKCSFDERPRAQWLLPDQEHVSAIGVFQSKHRIAGDVSYRSILFPKKVFPSFIFAHLIFPQ